MVSGQRSPYPMVVKLIRLNQKPSGILIKGLLSGSLVVVFSAKNIKAPNMVERIMRTSKSRFRILADLDTERMMTLRPG